MGAIHEFILERVDEDGSAALESLHRHPPEEPSANSRHSNDGGCWGPRRVLTECEIRREIVSTHVDGGCPQCLIHAEHGCETIRLLAEAWPAHPNYRSEWTSFHDGDHQMSPPSATKILEELSDPESPAIAKLTERESAILGSIAEGVDYRDIAKQLEISLNTVKNHVRNSVQKSQFHRRSDGPGPGGSPA